MELERAVAIVTVNRPVHENTAECYRKVTLEEEDVETLRSQITEPDAFAPQNAPENPRLAPTHS